MMVIFKMELIEGEELYYENPFKSDVAIGANPESLKDKPREQGFILRKGESISVKAKCMFIRVL